MTMLAGWTVVVTRPAHQAAGLVTQLEAAGARVLAWPTLAIDPVVIDAAQRECWSPERYDWLIYTSANAVDYGLRLWPRPARARVAAIGRATARALRARGVDVDVTPAGSADSEGLLAAPALKAVQGQRIVIVTGKDGRDTLRNALVSRGADVTLAELYSRRPVAWSPAAIETLDRELRDPQVVVTATSVEVFDALLRTLPAQSHEALVHTILLVPGERVAAAARAVGWQGALVIADSAEDDNLVAALVGWLATGAGRRA
jgi:uroporphyrinogen-III synthase